jgi:lipopolysaccharide transport system permease protein
MVVFSVVFGQLVQVPSGGIPTPLFYYAALVPWTWFSNSLAAASDSLVGQAHLVRRVYFPRLLVPLARILATCVDYLLALSVLVGMILWYGYVPSPLALIVIPAMTLLTLLTALGISLWFSAMNVRFRDVRYAVPFVIQLGLFITPVIYPTTLIEDEAVRTLLGINPMVSVIEYIRWVLLNTPTQIAPPLPMLVLSCATAFIILLSGLIYFSRAESTFADVV